MDCGYSLEPPLCFGQKLEKYFFKKITEHRHFYSFINCCILHGRVFVMSLSITNQQNNIVQSKESDRLLVSQFGQSVHVHSKIAFNQNEIEALCLVHM